MASSAETHREVLAKHGMAQSVLDEFVQTLDQFDAARWGSKARQRTCATRELRAVASEIVRTVRLMDGRNRQRFADEGQLLDTVSAQVGPGTREGGHGVGRGHAGRGGGEAGRMRGAGWKVDG